MADRRTRAKARWLFLATVVGALVLFVPGAAGATVPRCTITGTAGADTLRGTSKRDVICGLGGNDRVFGMAGNDVLVGGPGRDTLAGGPGHDLLLGSQGDDRLLGDAGNDTLAGEPGRDLIVGGAGDDLANGGAGADELKGLAGADRLLGGAGNDRVQGGGGADTLGGGAGLDVLAGGAADDAVAGGAHADTLTGGGGDDLLSGDGGNDTARGGSGSDRASGGAGRDAVHGDEDGDRLAGGSGADHVRGDGGDDKLTGGYAEVGKVWVCHWAGGPAGPAGGQGHYVAIHISVRGLEGHAGHPWDIVVDDPKACPGRAIIDPTEDDGVDPVDDGSDDDVDGGDGSDSCFVEDGKAPLGCEDLLAPRLESVTFDQPVINTGSGPVTVTADVRVTDNLSGADGVATNMYLGNVWTPHIDVRAVGRVSGTPNDGVYRYLITFPRYVPAGDYDFSIGTVDRDRNWGWNDPTRRAPGVSTIIRQVDPGDVTAPLVSAHRQDVETVDTSGAARTVVFTADFTDDVSGLREFVGHMTRPGETYSNANFGGYITTGTPMAGTTTFSITLPQYSRQGTYRVELVAQDKAGNSRVVGTRYIEQSGPGDTTGPAYSAVVVNPTSINTTLADATVTVDVRITDDMAGYDAGTIQFRSPDAHQVQSAWITAADRISGTALDGTYRVTLTIPRYSDLGEWTYSIGGWDVASNRSPGGASGPGFLNAS